MLDLGWTELLVIGLLALLVVGPKELPGMLRTLGQYVGKARSMAREFQRSMEDAAREADLGELTQLRDAKKELDNLARVDFSEKAKSNTHSAAGAAGSESAKKPLAGDPANLPNVTKPKPEDTAAPAPSTDAAPEEPAPKAQGDKG